MRSRIRQSCRGFTLIELLVSIAIIGVLIALVTISVGRAMRTAKGAAERQTVVALSQGVQAFKQEFGFLPPLVSHSDSVRPVEFYNSNTPPTPVINVYGGKVTDPVKGFNQNASFLEGFQGGTPGQSGTSMMSADWVGGTPGSSTVPDRRFSEYSLAYFLAGALSRPMDGVDGPGMFRPNADGTFQSGTGSMSNRVNKVSGRSYPPFVDTSRSSPRLETDLIAAQKDDSDITAVDPSTGAQVSVLTRYRLMSPSGQPYRYYRWSPRLKGPVGTTKYYNPATDAFDRAEQASDLFDVPSLLGDPSTDQNLRGAEYAIVSSGPDGLFGDMWLEAKDTDGLNTLATRLKVSADAKSVRNAMRADNIVEVGR